MKNTGIAGDSGDPGVNQSFQLSDGEKATADQSSQIDCQTYASNESIHDYLPPGKYYLKAI
jgi:hypothetical protein